MGKRARSSGGTATVWHVSHTDITTDARILKEMTALAEGFPHLRLRGVGIPTSEGRQPSSMAGLLDIRLWRPLVDRFGRAPRWLRLPLRVLEMCIRIPFMAKAEKPDVLHVHDVVLLPAATLASLMWGGKVIYDAHELESDRAGLGPVTSVLIRFIERMCWSRITGLITVSGSIESWYQQSYPLKPTTVVLNAPPRIRRDDREQVSEAGLRAIFGVPDEQILLLYVGLFSHGRGIEPVIELVKQDERFAFVCIGTGILQASIDASAAACPRIHRHPFVPNERLLGLIKTADVGVCLIEPISLSDRYSLPNKLFEYLFAGIPVVASDLPEIRHVVQTYDAGAVSTAVPEQIAAAAREAIEVWTRRDSVDRDLRPLSWEHQAHVLMEFYNRYVFT